MLLWLVASGLTLLSVDVCKIAGIRGVNFTVVTVEDSDRWCAIEVSLILLQRQIVFFSFLSGCYIRVFHCYVTALLE